MVNEGNRFKKTEKVDERRELIYDLLLQTHDTSGRDNAQNDENKKLLLKRQIAITDALILGPGIDLLLETLQLIVERKKWHCNVLIRSILILNKQDHDKGNEKGIFDKTKLLVRSLLDSGILSTCEGLNKNQAMHGLCIYFCQSSA